MSIDTKIIDDLDEDVRKVAEVKDHLTRLYYNEQFSSIFNRPVLSMLFNGCDYLSENIKLLREKYIATRS
jgi:hypothetical protein